MRTGCRLCTSSSAHLNTQRGQNISPEMAARSPFDELEAVEVEVLVDDRSRQVNGALSERNRTLIFGTSTLLSFAAPSWTLRDEQCAGSEGVSRAQRRR